MSSIRLSRVVRPGLVTRDSHVGIENTVESVCVKFHDDNGNELSLAFNCNPETSDAGVGLLRETYSRYTDCPAFYNSHDSGPVSDLATMRFMRDALIAMNLGPA